MISLLQESSASDIFYSRSWDLFVVPLLEEYKTLIMICGHKHGLTLFRKHTLG